MIFYLIVIPSLLLSIVIYASYIIAFGDNQRLNLGVQMLLANVFFCFVITRLVPLHKQAMLIQKTLEYALFTALALLLWNGVVTGIFKMVERFLNYYEKKIVRLEELHIEESNKLTEEDQLIEKDVVKNGKNDDNGDVNNNNNNNNNNNSEKNLNSSENQREKKKMTTYHLKIIETKNKVKIFISKMKIIDFIIYFCLLLAAVIHQMIYIGLLKKNYI